MAQTPPPPPLQYGTRSPDGRWWWDGQAWQPVPSGAPGQVPAMWMARPAPQGPLGKPRNALVSILLAIVTIGIYTWVWTYRTQHEIKEHSGVGVGGGLGLLIFILVSPVTFFLIASDVHSMYSLHQRHSPVSSLTGLWYFLPLIGWIIWFVKVQSALNDYWLALGAPPP